MSRVIIFSTVFPSYHQRKGEPTYFVEQLLNSLGNVKDRNDLLPGVADIVNDFFLLDGEHKKYHTIRAGHRWKVGDWFSPRVWSGKPYKSKQIIIAPDLQIKKIWDFKIKLMHDIFFEFLLNSDEYYNIDEIAKNDGLTERDFKDWFQYPKPFDGQIICWNENIDY